MKKFLKKHRVVLTILSILFVWRIYLLIIESFKHLVHVRTGYLGFIPQANFDGVFYLAISEFWYRSLDQAFFPVYPGLVWILIHVFSFTPASGAMIVSTVSLFFLLLFLYKLVNLEKPKVSAFWTILMFISFPTSFFLVNIYTESLFIALIILSFYLSRKNHRLLAGIFAAIATGTRVVGIFILPSLFMEYFAQLKKDNKRLTLKNIIYYFYPLAIVPLGLVSYMGYLQYRYGDPLLFIHIQPLFGAGRSGGDIILLPQVIYRYIKILLTVSPTNLTFMISALEMFVFVVGIIILIYAYKKGIRKSYILFSVAVLLFPTLSGTLSSIPRYILASFAIYIFLGLIKNRIVKITIISVGLLLQFVLALLFFQGYFIS